MGSVLNKISAYFSQHEQARILMFGLDAAGKTSILYMMKLGEVVTTIPTIGFNVETVTYGNIQLTTWDVGGRDKTRSLWRHYYANTSAIIFVVDSNDCERITEARDELFRMTGEEELKHVPVLIFANKQDLPSTMSLEKIREALHLTKFDEMNRKWHLQASSVPEKRGFNEGLKWLADVIKCKSDYIEPIKETMNDTKIMKKDLSEMWNLIDVKKFVSKFI